MHPTIFLVPPAMIAFAAIKTAAGPQKALLFSRKTAQFLTNLRLLPYAVPRAWEIRLLQKCTFPPHIACLELACAWQQWLALHGQDSTIHIGKRLANGKLSMHAWVTSTNASYFDAPGFEISFTQQM